MDRDTGSVVTGNGRVDPDDLGITLPHEHVFFDSTHSGYYSLPESSVDRKRARQGISIENLWHIKQNPWIYPDNMRLDSIETAKDELEVFQRQGGGTVVEVTPKNMGGDPTRSLEVASALDLKYVAGTAYYTKESHPDEIEESSVDEIADEFISDVKSGLGDTDIRAGIIGEIGLSEHIYPDEEKVLIAGARAALKTGASLMIHPPGRTPTSQRNRTYPSSRWGLEIVDIVESVGLPLERVVISHMDRTIYEDLSYQKQLIERGAYIEYDLWGYENYLQAYDDSYLSDSQRLDNVTELIAEGYAENLLFSHDVCQKIQLRKFGGFGYGHILESMVDALKSREITQDTIDQILVQNPSDMLRFEAPE